MENSGKMWRTLKKCRRISENFGESQRNSRIFDKVGGNSRNFEKVLRNLQENTEKTSAALFAYINNKWNRPNIELLRFCHKRELSTTFNLKYNSRKSSHNIAVSFSFLCS